MAASSTTDSQINAIRLEAVHKRVHAQQWASNSLPTLIKALATLLHTSTPNVQMTALKQIDNIQIAAEVAHATIATLTTERMESQQQQMRLKHEIQQEREEVNRLREQLQVEKRLASRRDGYDAIAKLILEEPSVEVSEEELKKKKLEWEAVNRQVDRILKAREDVRKEVLLLLKCARNLEIVANGWSGVLEGEVEEGEMEIEG